MRNRNNKQLFIFLLIMAMLIISCSDKESDSKNGLSANTKSNQKSEMQEQATPFNPKDLNIAKNFQSSLQSIAQDVKPAVVHIKAEKKLSQQPTNPFSNNPFFDEFFRNMPKRAPKRKAEVRGSGFIVSKEGYIVTNNHVIEKTTKITIYLDNEKEYPAQVIGADVITDLAVIKIDTKEQLPVVHLGDSDTVEVGNWAIAIGSPFGLTGSYTFGVVSATGRKSGGLDRNAVFKNFIQTDAPINQGNSGGPLLNINGEVIGVNTAIWSTYGMGSIGIGFAIPINITKKVITQLIDKGKVDRGFIGIAITDISEKDATYHGLDGKYGVRVNNVQPGGPADMAGIQEGDLIIKVNDTKVKNTAELIGLISNVLPNNKAKLTIIRNKNQKDIDIVVGKRPDRITWLNRAQRPQKKNESQPDEKEKYSAPQGSKTWKGLTFEYVPVENKENKEKKVVITKIDPNSVAYKSGLRMGDVVESINYFNIQDLSSLEKAFDDSKANKSHLFRVLRNGRRLFIVIKEK